MSGVKGMKSQRKGKCEQYRPSDGPAYDWKRCVRNKKHPGKHRDLTGWTWTDADRRRWDKP